MLPEKTFRLLNEKWPLPRGRCNVSVKLSRLLPTVLILMAVLLCSSCATTQKTQTEEIQTDVIKVASDTASSVIKQIRKEIVPASKAEIAIPVDSLLKLPNEAVYTHHSGQATATVAKKGQVIYVTSTCDSLQREVEYYEELYYKARDALQEYENRVQTEVKQPSNLLAKLTALFAMGLVAGILIVITIINVKRHGK